MTLTLQDLLNFKTTDYTDSAGSWDALADAVQTGRYTVDQTRLDLSDQWSGSAALAAEERLQGESGALNASASSLQDIASNLNTAATTLDGYRSAAASVVAEVDGDNCLSLDHTTGAVRVNPDAVRTAPNGGTTNAGTPAARAHAYQEQLQGILAKAQQADQAVAGKIDALLPPPRPTGYSEPTGDGRTPGTGSAPSGTPSSAVPTGDVPAATSGDIRTYQDYAKQRLAGEYGLSGAALDQQFQCLVNLWNRESSWNPQARNPSSGAFGIVQALPPEKMASAGADWATNYQTQINWGLDYIHSRYGTPCAAWQHEISAGWY